MRHYQGNYEFEYEGINILSTGKCFFSFYYDSDLDEVKSLELDLSDLDLWNTFKEQEITTIRNYHLKDIKQGIEEKVIDYAIQHELY